MSEVRVDEVSTSSIRRTRIAGRRGVRSSLLLIGQITGREGDDLIACQKRTSCFAATCTRSFRAEPRTPWAAIERTYTEDVTFIDPDREFIGRQALSDQKLLVGLLAERSTEEHSARLTGRGSWSRQAVRKCTCFVHARKGVR